MADKDDSADKGGQPTAGGEGWVKLSEFYPYGDSPPRLCAALNDTLTDASPTAEFAPAVKVRASNDKKKPGVPGAPMETPQRDEVKDPYQASVVHDILDWVARRLDLGLSAAWMSQIAQVAEWAPNGGPEEQWAQTITEMFLGVTYSGLGQTYQLGALQKRDPSGALVSNGGADPEKWEPMLFRRIARQQWRRKEDRFGLRSWDNLVPFDEDSEVPNTDPAFSLGTACQHLATYVVITRGIAVDATGNATVPATGLAASDQTFTMPVFGGDGYSKLPAGKSDKLPGFRLPKPRPKPKPGDPEVPPKPEETVAYYLDAKNAIAAGFGPGGVTIYDPDRGLTKASPPIYMTSYERNKYGPDEVKIYGVYFKRRASNEDKSAFGDDPEHDWTDKDRPIKEAADDLEACQARIEALAAKATRTKQEEASLAAEQEKKKAITAALGTDVGPRSPLPYNDNRQYDGSHIHSVLRKHPTKPMIQLLDVNLTENLSTLETTGSDSVMFEQHEGIVDGHGRTRIYDMNHGFAGLGVLPPHSVDQAQVDFLRKARPVGLGRVAITRRNDKAPMNITDADVLYVSRMMRLYGDEPNKNYTVARLLWSLRNTPGFSDVQVWWIVYVPRKQLAKAMWAHGARAMRLADYVAKYGAIRSNDVFLIIALTNLGRPPRAGHATLYSRNKSHPEGKKTVNAFVPHSPPLALMHYVKEDALGVSDNVKPTLAWNASHAHEKLRMDESKLPGMFQEGG